MSAPFDNDIAAQQAIHNALFQQYANEESIRGNNEIYLEHCEQERTNRVDIASGILAVATFLIYNRYYNKYKEVLDWRDAIGQRIKNCIEKDIDHYINIVMTQMNKAINSIFSAPTVIVNYADIVQRHNNYAETSTDAAIALIGEIDRKTCDDDVIECDHLGNDLKGWGVAAAISSSDGRARFDEARVPRRLDLHSGALDSAHSATFRLPDLDYQALSNAANISSSLASAYSGIANSALGSFGYFSTNFVNSLS